MSFDFWAGLFIGMLLGVVIYLVFRPVIERLAKRVEELERECGRFENELFEARAPLAQSNAEPVAWRVRDFGDDWILCHSREWAEREAESAGNLIQPLYTVPPRPDASAGLIEAAEWLEQQARTSSSYPAKEIHLSCSEALRARAADRSGK